MSLPSASPILPPADRLSVKKRKRDEAATSDTPTEIDSRPFAVRPAGDDVFAKTITFTPVCVLQRAQLPLAFLDSQGSVSRLFTAHIHALERFHANGDAEKILVAEQKEENRLYVVERAAKRAYALCRLGSWMNRDTLNRLAKTPSIAAERTTKRRAIDCASNSPWWAKAAVTLPEVITLPKELPSGLLRLSADLQLPKAAPTSGTIIDKAKVQTAGGHADNSAWNEEQKTNSLDLGSQDPLEELAKQYLDALYLSRTSLAYFAKGPLPRARTALTGAANTQADTSALAEFLRSSILSVTTMDKKYKVSIAAAIKEIPLVTPSQGDKTPKARRKKKFKAKRDKAGLFTNEHDYIEKWWRGEELPGSMTSPENADTALRRRIPGLRTRETYLQIIIILETLHLEATTHTVAQQTSETPGNGTAAAADDGETQDVESQATSTSTKRKPKKLQDLSSLLETLLDRLCIWQSLETHAPAQSLSDENEAKANEPSNELRDFCIEIIVPFFLSRLPKEAALVNKKLGGPSPPSPEKRKSTSSRSKPGEPAVRSRPEKQTRRPLSRVPTDTLNHASKPTPGLHRSATDSAIIKREDSQSPLTSIPPAAQPIRRPRESLMKSYSSGLRQVDLNANSAAAAEKLRKKKESEAQVREAIQNLRKPNRPMATKEVAARVDERFAQNLAKPSRSSRQQGVHVAATPKRVRPNMAPQAIPTSYHSSQPSVVPSSSARYRAAPSTFAGVDGTPAVPQTSHRDTAATGRNNAIEETPSRGSGKFTQVSPTAMRSAPIGFPPASVLCESPTAQRTSTSHHVTATPTKGRRISFGVVQTPITGNRTAEKGTALVEATPMKKAFLGAGDSNNSQEGYRGNESVYDVWNDDDYEELA